MWLPKPFWLQAFILRATSLRRIPFIGKPLGSNYTPTKLFRHVKANAILFHLIEVTMQQDLQVLNLILKDPY